MLFFFAILTILLRSWNSNELLPGFSTNISFVFFVIFVSKDFKDHKTYIIGENNYGILSIPPNVWYCFKGLSKKTSLILNITDSEHNEEEIKKINLDEFPLKINLWKQLYSQEVLEQG